MNAYLASTLEDLEDVEISEEVRKKLEETHESIRRGNCSVYSSVRELMADIFPDRAEFSDEFVASLEMADAQIDRGECQTFENGHEALRAIFPEAI